jgi:nucleotide-binding universal stress UspA family protein
MKTAGTGTRIAVKNVLFRTDFSEPSEAALPFASAVAREFGAKIHVLHVLIPAPYMYMAPDTIAMTIDAQEESAQGEMQRVESQFAGLPHEAAVVCSPGIWPALERAISDCNADMIVLGMHGRTGAQKVLLGSAAEEIFRRAGVPVLTIGPSVRKNIHNGARFNRVLFATDFTPESLAAAPYAVSLAEENQARLVLLHVIPHPCSEAANLPRVGEAVIRITLTTICGTDVYILKGEYKVRPGLVIGHEPVGVIHELGEGVTGYHEGERVLVGAITPCGQCSDCLSGHWSQCGGPNRRLEIRQHDSRRAGRIFARAPRTSKSSQDSG